LASFAIGQIRFNEQNDCLKRQRMNCQPRMTLFMNRDKIHLDRLCVCRPMPLSHERKIPGRICFAYRNVWLLAAWLVGGSALA